MRRWLVVWVTGMKCESVPLFCCWVLSVVSTFSRRLTWGGGEAVGMCDLRVVVKGLRDTTFFYLLVTIFYVNVKNV